MLGEVNNRINWLFSCYMRPAFKSATFGWQNNCFSRLNARAIWYIYYANISIFIHRENMQSISKEIKNDNNFRFAWNDKYVDLTSPPQKPNIKSFISRRNMFFLIWNIECSYNRWKSFLVRFYHFRDLSNNQFQNIPDDLFEHLVSLRRV